MIVLLSFIKLVNLKAIVIIIPTEKSYINMVFVQLVLKMLSQSKSIAIVEGFLLRLSKVFISFQLFVTYE